MCTRIISLFNLYVTTAVPAVILHASLGHVSVRRFRKANDVDITRNPDDSAFQSQSKITIQYIIFCSYPRIL